MSWGEGRLTNIFGWRDYDLRTRNDIDSSPGEDLPFGYAHQAGAVVERTLLRGRFRRGGADRGRLRLPPAGRLRRSPRPWRPTQYGGGVQEHDVYGLYAQADYDLTEGVTLTAGLRWSREEKDAVITYVRPRAPARRLTRPARLRARTCRARTTVSPTASAWGGFSPRVALAFKPIRTTAIYAQLDARLPLGRLQPRITQPPRSSRSPRRSARRPSTRKGRYVRNRRNVGRRGRRGAGERRGAVLDRSRQHAARAQRAFAQAPASPSRSTTLPMPASSAARVEATVRPCRRLDPVGQRRPDRCRSTAGCSSTSIPTM